jgi:hypothetical protein
MAGGEPDRFLRARFPGVGVFDGSLGGLFRRVYGGRPDALATRQMHKTVRACCSDVISFNKKCC